jgi:hypothetical protein
MATQATNKHKALEDDRRTKAYRILEALYSLALDENEATQNRVSAGKTYLSKTMPDLKAIEHSGGLDVDMHVTAVEWRVIDPPSGIHDTPTPDR